MYNNLRSVFAVTIFLIYLNNLNICLDNIKNRKLYRSNTRRLRKTNIIHSTLFNISNMKIHICIQSYGEIGENLTS